MGYDITVANVIVRFAPTVDRLLVIKLLGVKVWWAPALMTLATGLAACIAGCASSPCSTNSSEPTLEALVYLNSPGVVVTVSGGACSANHCASPADTAKADPCQIAITRSGSCHLHAVRKDGTTWDADATVTCTDDACGKGCTSTKTYFEVP